jgi:hypothetical protein
MRTSYAVQVLSENAQRLEEYVAIGPNPENKLFAAQATELRECAQALKDLGD